GGDAVGIVYEADLVPALRACRRVQQAEKVLAHIGRVGALTREDDHLAPENRVVEASTTVSGVHALADLLGVHAVALGRLVGVGLAVPGISLLTVLHRPAEGVLDLVAFRGACGGTMPAADQQGCQGQSYQGASREESLFAGVHDCSSY